MVEEISLLMSFIYNKNINGPNTVPWEILTSQVVCWMHGYLKSLFHRLHLVSMRVCVCVCVSAPKAINNYGVT